MSNPAPKASFKLALAQIRVQGGAPKENLQRALQQLAEAAHAGAQAVLLPEAMNLGWAHSSARTQAEPIPGGPTCTALCQSAREHGLFVCAGLIEKDRDQIYNAALLISPEGKVLTIHRKLYELDFAHPLYSLGDRLQVARTPLGTIGVMICADGFAPGQVISRSLALMGADIILSPSAWAVPADHDNARDPYGQLWLDNYGPVARDFQLWIASTSNVGWITDGPWQGRPCIGCSMVIGPAGTPVLRGPYGADAEGVLFCDIEPVPRPARGDLWPKIWGKSIQADS